MGAILNISILTDAKKARAGIDDTVSSLGDLDNAARRSGDVLAGIGKAAIGLGIAGAAGIGALAVGAFQAAEESAKIARETERVIKTTGGAANLSAQQVGDLAGSISDLTGADDELIQSSANLLLTFTNIKDVAGDGNDVFSQATALSLDMATALGTDASGAAIQLGKALNDPIKGISALSKSGVSFTEEQKEQIRVLQESGDTLGAQKIILGELSKEFAGAAQAASTPLDHLKVQFGNLQEEIGAKLIPIVDTAATFLGEKLPVAIAAGQAKLDEWWPTIESGATAVGKVLQDVGENVQTGLAWLTDPQNDEVLKSIGITVGVILVASFVALGVSAAGAAVGVIAATWPLIAIAAVIGGLVFLFLKAYENFALFRTGIDAGKQALSDLWNGVLLPLGAWLQDQWNSVILPALVTGMSFLATNVLPLVGAAFQWFYDNAIKPVFDFIAQNQEMLVNLGKVFLVIAAIVVGVVVVSIVALIAAVAIVTAGIGFLIARAVQVQLAIIAAAQDFWSSSETIRSAIGRVIDFFELLIQKGWEWANAARDAIGGAASFIGEKVSQIIGVFSGLRDSLNFGGMFDGLKNAFRDAINFVINGWNRLSFSLPSIPGTDIGGFTIAPPRIQPLASGGIVTSPTFALLGERGPEAVIPLSALDRMGGDTYNIYVPSTGLGPDSPQVARDVVAAIKTHTRLNGPLVLT